jgi:hypothetical protein
VKDADALYANNDDVLDGEDDFVVVADCVEDVVQEIVELNEWGDVWLSVR